MSRPEINLVPSYRQASLQHAVDYEAEKGLTPQLTSKQFFEINIHDFCLSDLLHILEDRIAGRFTTHIVPINPHVYQLIYDDQEYLQILREADIALCDGMGVLLASKLLRHSIRQRMVGTDLMLELVRLSAQKGYRIFLMGGIDGAARLCSETLLKVWPNLNLVGWYEPPLFDEIESLDNGEIRGRINRSKADIVFVALGAPKQERWIHGNRKYLEASVLMGVGASFNLISGRIARAPLWVREIGFEWLFRLMVEPRRLWKRYLIGNPLFVVRILGERLRRLQSNPD